MFNLLDFSEWEKNGQKYLFFPSCYSVGKKYKMPTGAAGPLSVELQSWVRPLHVKPQGWVRPFHVELQGWVRPLDDSYWVDLEWDNIIHLSSGSCWKTSSYCALSMAIYTLRGPVSSHSRNPLGPYIDGGLTLQGSGWGEEWSYFPDHRLCLAVVMLSSSLLTGPGFLRLCRLALDNQLSTNVFQKCLHMEGGLRELTIGITNPCKLILRIDRAGIPGWRHESSL